jgi:hypothetical protein
VIEVNAGPVLFPVTVAASVAVAPGMHIIQAVAAVTRRGQLPVLLSCMAAVAVNVHVLATQCKVRLLVVKRLLLPALLDMTCGAVIIQPFSVNIIFPVATLAAGRRVPVFLPVRVTGTAPGNGVRSL